MRVHRVGVCGTDLSGYLGKMPFLSYPRIMGHELGVEVIAVGPGVDNVAPGDRCSVEPYMNCGTCHACRKGATNCCANLKVLGVMTDGGLRDRFVLRADKLHVSKKLELRAARTGGNIGHRPSLRESPSLAKGENCLVIGAGPIGLSAIVFAKLIGARVIVLDMSTHRLEFCRKRMGVDETIVLSDQVEADLAR